MPEISSIMDSAIAPTKAEVVAKETIQGIKSATFSISCKFDGRLMTIATAGFSPQRCFFMASIEVVFAGLCRFVALLLLWNFYGLIRKHQNPHKKPEPRGVR
ncbi:hypothetical protein F3Y22_tig00112236pilonHSYRG00029 [Hibiscus syriacus]|uniref:Uncharacterized protein n=1 Tax=Hibiscus syriacus TaxID=106335 RepID=A0A6A2X3B0_HIBSY|nr:hypothetical protein F3Y22_tig00112236pilonHSYRG00029 [Hibiscus syriacus]